MLVNAQSKAEVVVGSVPVVPVVVDRYACCGTQFALVGEPTADGDGVPFVITFVFGSRSWKVKVVVGIDAIMLLVK